MRVLSAVTQWWYTSFFRWLDNRAPASQQHTLHLKNLYVLPTLTGWMFLVLAGLIWLLGTNYQNNLILALSYLQVSLLVVVILSTYNNLAGTKIRYLGSESNFAGGPLFFDMELVTSNAQGGDNIVLRWLTGSECALNLETNEPRRIRLSIPSTRRGRVRPGHLLLKSQYPLSMVRSWTYLRFPAEVTVYPVPQASTWKEHFAAVDSKQKLPDSAASGETSGFRSYAVGDSPKHISWKHYARGQELVTKMTSSSAPSGQWLDWASFFRGDTELCLSNLCYWSLELSNSNQPFGLRLPGLEIKVGQGQAHLRNVLEALALFGERAANES